MARGRVILAYDALGKHTRAKPTPLDFYSEEEMAEWEAEKARLIAECGRLAPEAHTLGSVAGHLRIQTINAAKRVETAQYVVANLARKLDDPTGSDKAWMITGGVGPI